MSFSPLKETLDFLSKLAENNTREWFQQNKSQYLQTLSHMTDLAEEVHGLLSNTDHIETPSGKKSLHRIYRDVRFSKDKTPYHSHFGGSFRRATALLRGGYYYHIEPGNSCIMGGFWGPNSEDLLHIRKQIQQEPDILRDIMNSPSFSTHFGQLQGAQLKSHPRGFDAKDPAINLLRYKQFIVRHNFTDQEVLNKNFAEIMVDQFQNMRPFFDYMSEILTTDLNGESIT